MDTAHAAKRIKLASAKSGAKRLVPAPAALASEEANDDDDDDDDDNDDDSPRLPSLSLAALDPPWLILVITKMSRLTGCPGS
jgi:hypothetical protein